MGTFDWQLIPWGVAIGLAVSAPLGPINFMCIRHTVQFGFWGGVFTGIGSVIGDVIFAIVAGLGITAVAGLIAAYTNWLLLVGGCFLLILGLVSFRARVTDAEMAKALTAGQRAAIVSTTLALTLTNPFTFTGFISMFGGLSGQFATGAGYGPLAVLVVSVALGSSLWWIFLARLVAVFRNRIDARRLTAINKVTGAAVVVFGLFVLGKLAATIIA